MTHDLVQSPSAEQDRVGISVIFWNMMRLDDFLTQYMVQTFCPLISHDFQEIFPYPARVPSFPTGSRRNPARSQPNHLSEPGVRSVSGRVARWRAGADHGVA